jgi:hypothetical protein
MSRSLRIILLATVALVASMAFAGSALAQGAPKFHAATSAVNNDGALVASWDERGLGNANIDYTLSADAEAVYACINRGGNHPEAANKETINAEVSANGSFEPKNGRIQASLTAGPPSAGSFTCPGGQRLVLASVAYTNIVLTDTTNGVTATLPDVSRVFLAV